MHRECMDQQHTAGPPQRRDGITAFSRFAGVEGLELADQRSQLTRAEAMAPLEDR